MIYTITPNPVLDVYGSIDRLCINEKNYVQEVCRFAGGNGVNVARMLTRLNEPCIATGFLGGAAGEEVRRNLSRESVRHSFVKIRDVTRSNVTVTQRLANNQTRLSFPGPQIRPDEIRMLEEKVKAVPPSSVLMLGGSLPEKYSVRKLRSLLKEARRKSIPVALDAPPSILIQCIKSRPTLIKPNLHEFQELMGRTFRSVSSIVKAAYELTGYVPLVCVSSVEGGAVLVTRQSAWFGKGRLIRSRSSVGAGDSMLAGMLCDLHVHDRGADLDDALLTRMLRRGIASGMATASRPAGHLGQARDVENFMNQVAIQALPQ